VEGLTTENIFLRKELEVNRAVVQALEREVLNQLTESFSKNLGQVLATTPNVDISPIKSSVRTIVDRLQFLDSQFLVFQDKITELEQMKSRISVLQGFDISGMQAKISCISEIQKKLSRLDSFDPREFHNVKFRVDRICEDILELSHMFEGQEEQEEHIAKINHRLHELESYVSHSFEGPFIFPPGNSVYTNTQMGTLPRGTPRRKIREIYLGFPPAGTPEHKYGGIL